MKTKENPVVDLVCDTVTKYRMDYYDITNISGDVKNIEKTPNGVNVIVVVGYSTKIKAETPDDSPYIKGIKVAIADLTEKEDIEKATKYLERWRGELERDHIGKELSHNSEFKVNIPKDNINCIKSKSDVNTLDYLENLCLDNAEIMYRVQKIVPDNQDKAYGIDEIDSDP